MANYVTSTINQTTVTVKACDFIKGKFEDITVKLNGIYSLNNEDGTDNTEMLLKLVNKSINNPKMVAGMISNIETSSIKYAMSEETFLMFAKKVDKRDNGAYVFRTVKTNKYEISVFDTEDEKLYTVTRTNKNELDKYNARKIYSNLDNNTTSIVGVKKIDVIEDYYQMSVEDFMVYGNPVVEQ